VTSWDEVEALVCLSAEQPSPLPAHDPPPQNWRPQSAAAAATTAGISAALRAIPADGGAGAGLPVDPTSGLPYFFAAAVRASALYCLSKDYASLLKAASFASGSGHHNGVEAASSVSTMQLAQMFQARLLSQTRVAVGVGVMGINAGDARASYIHGSQCTVVEPRVQSLRRLVTRLQSEAWRMEGLLRQQAGASANAAWAIEELEAGDLPSLQDELRRLRAKLALVTADRDKKNTALLKAHRMSVVTRQHVMDVDD
jgi:hypothetical protein